VKKKKKLAAFAANEVKKVAFLIGFLVDENV
jgi:hypothetical protein